MPAFLMNYIGGETKKAISFNLTHCTINGETPTTIKKELTVQFTPDVKYAITQEVITVTNATLKSFDASTNTLVIEKPTANVVVTVTAFEVDYLCFTANTAESTISMSGNSKNIEYSSDCSTWNTFTVGTTIITLANIGDKVYFKGTNLNGQGMYGTHFVMTGSISASGDVTTLLSEIGNVLNLAYPIYLTSAFYELFLNCTSLISSPILPSTTLYQYCYQSMFSGCTNLTTAPNLPATTLADYCYYNMFSNCTMLTTTPELPATTLTEYCYYGMFQGCTSLTTAPELPATTLADKCYDSMFYGCSSLTTAPELPATTLADKCYYSMFYGCSSLTTAPELPATTLADKCYYSMFYGCSSLTTAPELPATTLADKCYYSMFYRCSSLATAPALPATTLASNCYDRMFAGCTSLTTAPELPATTLAEDCYSYMFSSCQNLTTLPLLPATTLTPRCYSSMFKSCVKIKMSTIQTSEYQYPYTFGTIPNSTSAEDMFLYTGGTFRGTPVQQTYYTSNVIIPPDYLCFTAITADSTIELTAVGSPSISNTAYSRDIHTWINFTPSTKRGTNTITLTNIGDKVYFRNTITGDFSISNYLQFVMTGRISASGNCNSLYNVDNFMSLTTLTYKYCYFQLFRECTSLTTAPALPAMTLSNWCYCCMFAGCTSLTTAPELPATTLAEHCYDAMFNVCNSLITAPELPATILARSCYDSMFMSCSNLVNAPELPVTTLANYCYDSMFYGCRSLINAPALPATTLASSCYYRMFYECTNLITLPALSAGLTNYCYFKMFSGCSKIKISSTQTEEYQTPYIFGGVPDENNAENMFENTGGTFTGTPTQQIYYTSNTIITPPDYLCFTANTAGSTISMTGSDKNLEYSTNKATWNTFTVGTTIVTLTNVGDKVYFRGTNNGMGGSNYAHFTMTGSINASGDVTTLLEPQGNVLDLSTKDINTFSGLFIDCKALQTPPSLPSTTLTTSCYTQLFFGCLNLISPPTLSATTLATDCYKQMFNLCFKVRVSDTQTGDYQTPYTFGAIPSDTTASEMFVLTGGSFISTPTQQTYYISTVPFQTEHLCFTANTEGSTVSMSKFSSSAPNLTLYYSTDDITWDTFIVGSTTITLTNVGDKVYFKGNNRSTGGSDLVYCNRFVLTGSVSASGDVTTLLNEEGNILYLDSRQGNVNDYTFAYLFINCTSLTSAPKLPSLYISIGGYYHMFEGCTNLTTTPSLPARYISAYSYQGMFYGCSALTTISKLPATSLLVNCYSYMYTNCSNIKMSATQTATYPNAFTFGSTPASSRVTDMFKGTGGTFTGTPSKQTYYTSNTIIS